MFVREALATIYRSGYTSRSVACLKHALFVAPRSTYWHRLVSSRGIRTSSEVLPAAPSLQSLTTPQETEEARRWLERFRNVTIPKDVVEMTFSRSSGPGGQNVNKVNTKATLRCPIDAPWIPLWAREGLRKSPHFASSSRSVLITSTMTRSQSQNVGDCLSKLHALIMSTSSAPIKNEPTEEQKERIRQLERVDKARRRTEKVKRSQTKRGRSGRDWE